MNPSQLEIIESILCHYGYTDQKSQAVEELLELAVKLQQSRRKLKDTSELRIGICSEIADVIIMVEQLKMIFDRQLIASFVNEKLDRELKRINS